ncbi:MAG: dihydrolipoamide acetyltransferase family protein [Pseudomonadota bacterium]
MADALYPITMPKWGIEMQEGTITAWQIEIGGAVTKGDELIDIETDKIVNSMEAPVDGVVCRHLVAEGDTLKVGELLGVIATAADVDDAAIDAFVKDFVPADASFGIDDEEASVAPAAEAAPPAAPASSGGNIRVSPVAKRRAKELGVDLSAVVGTGRNGRISKEDVEVAAASAGSSTEAPTVTAMSSRRQTIARRLTQSKQDIPHYYLTRSIDVTAALAQKSSSVSLNAILLKAIAAALVKHPNVNCHVVDNGVQSFDSVDINMAVDTENGLSAPLLRDVASQSLSEITTAAAAIADKARSNQLSASDLELGGFTVSNLGALGIESFTAIINPPQAAILAVGAAVDGHMKVTMSADHRVIDGADGARFLQTLADCLQNTGG